VDRRVPAEPDPTLPLPPAEAGEVFRANHHRISPERIAVRTLRSFERACQTRHRRIRLPLSPCPENVPDGVSRESCDPSAPFSGLFPEREPRVGSLRRVPVNRHLRGLKDRIPSGCAGRIGARCHGAPSMWPTRSARASPAGGTGSNVTPRQTPFDRGVSCDGTHTRRPRLRTSRSGHPAAGRRPAGRRARGRLGRGADIGGGSRRPGQIGANRSPRVSRAGPAGSSRRADRAVLPTPAGT
jgi:hypothetical protein